MDEPADVSSENRTRHHLLDEGSSTRNRKVVGSNPTSGSKAAGQRAFPALLNTQRHPDPTTGRYATVLVGICPVREQSGWVWAGPAGGLGSDL